MKRLIKVEKEVDVPVEYPVYRKHVCIYAMFKDEKRVLMVSDYSLSPSITETRISQSNIEMFFDKGEEITETEFTEAMERVNLVFASYLEPAYPNLLNAVI